MQTAADGTIETIPLEATVQESPAQIRIKSYAAGTFDIFRKDPVATSWGTALQTSVALPAEGIWTDNSVTAGTLYEYKFVQTSGSAHGGVYPTGYILCGIGVDQTQPRGRMTVVVASDVLANIPGHYAEYKDDLRADGWTVHEIPCPRSPDYSGNLSGYGYMGSGNAAVKTVSVITGGTGYLSTAYITLTNTTGKTALAKAVATSGVITSATILSGGAGFALNDTLTVSTTPGSGASLKVTSIDNSGVGEGVVVTGGGSGYQDNDTVTIAGATSSATAIGSIVAPTGAITSVSVVLPNTFTPGEALIITPNSTGSGATAIVGAATEHHLLIRSAIQAIDTAYPGELQNVVLIGKVPVCRSGISGPWTDGHSTIGSGAADTFYADMDGTYDATGWRDTSNNSSSGSTYSTTPLKFNMAGDKKFDADFMYQVGNGRVELGFGRIDLSLGISLEWEGLKTYFDKLHRYKIASPVFQPGRKVCDRFTYANVRETNLQAMPGVVGMGNIDFIGTADLPAVNSGEDADQAYSALHGPYLFYFKGSNQPLLGEGGRAVFWTGMQSQWGRWYDDTLISSNSNAMQRRLGEDNFTLSYTWDIWGLRYNYHRMGMGLDAGDMMKQSINNSSHVSGLYSYKFNNTSNGDCNGGLFMNHMGDPALRLFMFAPPSDLSIAKSGSNPSLTWVASPEPTVTGYHVYRKTSRNGPFVRLTSTAQAGTAYIDTTANSGTYNYMVRAVRLESSGGGTYYNASLGIEQTIDLTNGPAPLSITGSTALPDANWNTSYSQTLNAQGGTPQFTWSLASGALPPGLSLSPSGVISGVPTTPGTFFFTVLVTDYMSATAQKVQTLTVTSNTSISLYPEATGYTDFLNQSSNFSSALSTKMGASNAYKFETFERYDLSGVNLSNGLIKAILQLYVTPDTTPNSSAIVRADLIEDAGDDWAENGVAKFFTGVSNNGSGKTRVACPAHGFQTGDKVTLSGLSGSGAPSGAYAITVIDADTFDITTLTYATWTYDPAFAYATGPAFSYTNRPTGTNPNVSTVSSLTPPVANTILELDVTAFVAETLANDPNRKLTVRLHSLSTDTIAVGGRHAYGSAKPRLVIQTTDAPAITITSPAVNPAYIYTGSSLLLDATVSAVPARAAGLSVSWSMVSGPGIAIFSGAATTTPTVTFSAPGTYLLRLTANDGVFQSTQDLTIQVLNENIIGTTENMTLRLPFNEGSGTSVADLSGMNNNGTLNAAVTWGTGKFGNAIAVGDPLINSIANIQNGTGSHPQLTCISHGLPSTGFLTFTGTAITGTGAPTGTRSYSKIDDDNILITNGANYSPGWYWAGATVTTAKTYVRVPHSSTLDNTQKLSVSAWIKPALQDASERSIISKAGSSNGNRSYGLAVNGGKVTAVIANASPFSVKGVTVMTLNTWHHVVMTFDGSLSSNNTKVYLDGNLDGSGQYTVSSVPLNAASPLWIGCKYDSDTLPYKGMIDECRIYQGKALTAAEVQELHTGAPSNMGPQVSLQSTLSGTAGTPITLNATATDDGVPSSLDLHWSMISGSGTATFANAAAASTSVTFSIPGTAVLRLTANDGAVTTLSDVTVTVAPSPYQVWLQANGLPLDGTGIGAPLANPSGDGVLNAMKYALGLQLTDASYGGRVLTSVMNLSGSQYLSLTYSRPEPAPEGTSYAVTVSSDLRTWNAAETTEVRNTVADSLRTITVRDNQAINGATTRFIRLEISVP